MKKQHKAAKERSEEIDTGWSQSKGQKNKE